MSLNGSAESVVKLRGSLSMPEAIVGKSAYEIAVMHGFEGTAEEWIASLKGEQGKQGIDGEQGVGITDATVNADEHLILTLSNGKTIDAGEITVSGGSSGGGSTTIDVTADAASSSEKELLLLSEDAAVAALDSCAQNHKPAILTIVYTSVAGDFHDCTSMVINLPPHNYDAVHASYSENDFATLDPYGQIVEIEYYADYKGYELGWRGATSTSWWWTAIEGLTTNNTKVYLTY